MARHRYCRITVPLYHLVFRSSPFSFFSIRDYPSTSIQPIAVLTVHGRFHRWRTVGMVMDSLVQTVATVHQRPNQDSRERKRMKTNRVEKKATGRYWDSNGSANFKLSDFFNQFWMCCFLYQLLPEFRVACNFKSPFYLIKFFFPKTWNLN